MAKISTLPEGDGSRSLGAPSARVPRALKLQCVAPIAIVSMRKKNEQAERVE
jgi:hypothetical protein